MTATAATQIAADLIDDAPEYGWWAGDSAAADAIYASDDLDLKAEFKGRCITAIADLIDGGMDASDALASYDPDVIAQALV